jgi:hypothetical protein
MQSSCKNSEKERLSAARHSLRLSFCGELGARPTGAFRPVAVDKAEAADLGLRLLFASAAEDQPCGRADPTGEDEAEAERACRDGRKVGAKLAADVRRFADALAQRVGSLGELLALGLDLAANVLERAGVPTCHRS